MEQLSKDCFDKKTGENLKLKFADDKAEYDRNYYKLKDDCKPNTELINKAMCDVKSNKCKRTDCGQFNVISNSIILKNPIGEKVIKVKKSERQQELIKENIDSSMKNYMNQICDRLDNLEKGGTKLNQEQKAVQQVSQPAQFQNPPQVQLPALVKKKYACAPQPMTPTEYLAYLQKFR